MSESAGSASDIAQTTVFHESEDSKGAGTANSRKYYNREDEGHLRVFISYGDAADQLTALRLQALGAVNGLTVYVPPANTRQSPSGLLDPESAQKMNEADVILGVVASGLSEACRQELKAALAAPKPTIVIAYPQFAPVLQPAFALNLIIIDPMSPDQAELGIVQHLKRIHAARSASKALLALGTLALGLLILAPQD
jgi:hypothetical protein